jgi:hypothetical protein
MQEQVQRLLERARGPLGPTVRVSLDETSGPLAELAELLSEHNGCYLFNAGVQVFRASPEGLGPQLQTWNTPQTWKDTYQGLADGMLCFAQDVFGTQFAVIDNREIISFDPETAQRTVVGQSLVDWASWLLADPDINGTYRIATAWQDENGPLDHDQRLIPWRFFVMGGSYELANLVAKPAVECMRIRGPIAQQIHNLPDGAQIRLSRQ